MKLTLEQLTTGMASFETPADEIYTQVLITKDEWIKMGSPVELSIVLPAA